MKLLATACLLLVLPATAQQGKSTYAQTWDDMLHRAEGNHSPTLEEIIIAESPAEPPTANSVTEALPVIHKALTSSDVAVRTYALTALTGLELPPSAPEMAATAAASSSSKPDTEVVSLKSNVPQSNSLFRSEIATVLIPLIPDLGRELADDLATNRILAAGLLGGFAPSPPTSVFTPLLAYLKRDDGVGPAASAIVDNLLLFTPISDETASALIRYLRRSDQSADSRSGLIDSIASHVNQNQAVNKALLAYLNTDEPSIRARLILSLPQLDLAPDVFADARARVSILASNNQENLQVVNAAKAVSACWTATRMLSGCPVY